MAHLHKTKLQTFAQKKKIPLPTYTVETQGPPHARLFKAQVTIDGNTYAGPGFSSTLKDAEHEAAKVALMSLSQDGAQEDDTLYKSLLQELAQKKGLILPVYTTNTTGQPHMPCFVSTVEVSGQSYVGEDARTKKQSEMNAAKVAYKALTEGGPQAKNATTISNTVGASSSGSCSLQTVTTHKNELTSSKVHTIINSGPTYTIPDDPEKAKGYLELKDLQDVIEEHKMTLPPVMIHQPQPQSTPNVVAFAKPDIKQKNDVTQACQGSGSNAKRVEPSFNERTLTPVMDLDSAKLSPSVVDIPKPSMKPTNVESQASEGARVFISQHSWSVSNGKKIQPFVKEANLNIVMDSGSGMPHSIKIVIRPHVQGMTYDGPIQVADEEWVAMKVKVEDGM